MSRRYTVNDTFVHEAVFLNSDGTPLTGKAAFLTTRFAIAENPVTGATLTFPTWIVTSPIYAESPASSGRYVRKAIGTQAAKITVVAHYEESGQISQDYMDSFEIITAVEANPSDPAAIATAVFESLVPGGYPSGSAGYAIGQMLSGGITVITSGPIVRGRTWEIVRGDDYDSTEGRQLYWVTDADSEWPALTGATIAMTAIYGRDPVDSFTASGTVVQATGANKRVEVELTSAMTINKSPGDWSYDVQAILSGSSRKISLALGTLKVLEDYTP